MEKISSVLSIEDEDDKDWAILQLIQESGPEDPVEQLEALAERIVNPYDKTQAYIELFNRCKAKDLPRAHRYLETAREHSVQSCEFWQPADSLSRIGSLYAELGNINRAISIWNEAVASAEDSIKADPRQDAISCFGILGEIAIKFSEVKMPERALEIARLIKIDKIRDYAIEKTKNAGQARGIE